jgi:SAM-dependent methyltransferase
MNDPLVEQVSCDACGSKESECIYALTDTAHFVPGRFELHRCLKCGLRYLNPRPKAEAMARYYPPDYDPFKQPIEDEKFQVMRWMRRRKLQKRRELVEDYSGLRTGRILDVGCATGLFLNEMKQAGWHSVGVELMAPAAAVARQRFDIEVFEGTLTQAAFAPSSFDVISFWDVLEHSFSPRKELQLAARLLRPGGTLALSVPNWDSFDRWLFGRHWQGLDAPRHLFVFAKNSLSHLLLEAGFTDLRWGCFMPGYFSFLPSLRRWLNTVNPNLAASALKILSVPGMRFLFEPWFAALNALGLGTVISVFGRKAE